MRCKYYNVCGGDSCARCNVQRMSLTRETGGDLRLQHRYKETLTTIDKQGVRHERPKIG